MTDFQLAICGGIFIAAVSYGMAYFIHKPKRDKLGRYSR
jgi:hypothetical protein